MDEAGFATDFGIPNRSWGGAAMTMLQSLLKSMHLSPPH